MEYRLGFDIFSAVLLLLTALGGECCCAWEAVRICLWLQACSACRHAGHMSTASRGPSVPMPELCADDVQEHGCPAT